MVNIVGTLYEKFKIVMKT